MKRIICIGKWIKGKKSVVIDLKAYRDARIKSKTKGGQDGQVPQGRKKEK